MHKVSILGSSNTKNSCLINEAKLKKGVYVGHNYTNYSKVNNSIILLTMLSQHGMPLFKRLPTSLDIKTVNCKIIVKNLL